MRDVDTALSDILAAITAEAACKGPRAMARLAQGLNEYARKIRKTRGLMTADVACHCSSCGKRWAVEMTVERADAWGVPDECPTCYNARNAGKRSGWTDTFRYVADDFEGNH